MATLNPDSRNPAGGRGSGEAHRRSSRAENGSPGVAAPASVELVLSRLEKVRKAGTGHTARCPAHEDRTASLSTAVGNDGRVLIHCFAGCAPADVLAAIGLTISDLFPKRLADATPETRKALHALALRAQIRACANLLDHESTIVLIAASDTSVGRPLEGADLARLALAADRIRTARVAIGGVR